MKYEPNPSETLLKPRTQLDENYCTSVETKWPQVRNLIVTLVKKKNLSVTPGKIRKWPQKKRKEREKKSETLREHPIQRGRIENRQCDQVKYKSDPRRAWKWLLSENEGTMNWPKQDYETIQSLKWPLVRSWYNLIQESYITCKIIDTPTDPWYETGPQWNATPFIDL